MRSGDMDKIVRIVDVLDSRDDRHRVIVAVGDLQQAVDAIGQRPAAGDVFVSANTDHLVLDRKIGEASPGGWSVQGDGMRWRSHNGNGQTRYSALWDRHKIRRAVRSFLDTEGFIEIDTPLLVRGTTPDANIQSFKVDARYLVTSTEYQIKRLEVGGFDRIYTLTQNFRRSDGEGRFRNQEFTMLEWARVGESLDAIEQDAEALTLAAHHALGGQGQIVYGGQSVNLGRPWDRISVRQAIERFAGVSLPDFSLPTISSAVSQTGISVQPSWQDDIHVLFSLLMDHIQPRLGVEKPVFVRDWPSFETSSAAEKPGGIAERSELFIAGVEISDGFPSLTDPTRQLETFGRQNARRQADGIERVLLDEAYLTGLRAGLPKGAGMALGFDRLVMLLTDRVEIEDVLAFAWDEL